MNPITMYLMMIPNLAITLLPLALLICAILAVIKPVEDKAGSKRPIYATLIGWMLICYMVLPQLNLLIQAPAAFSLSFSNLTILGLLMRFGGLVLGVSLAATLLRMHTSSVILAAIIFLFYLGTSVWGLLRMEHFPSSVIGIMLVMVVPAIYGLIWRYTWRLKSKGLLR